MVAWLRARSLDGKVVFRMEDLDHPKDKPGADVQAVEDLRWLGFDWDEEYVQSKRKAIYREALQCLRNQTIAQSTNRKIPLVYPCVCSRRDVEAAQSAPHAGEQLHYPGTCRGRFSTWAEAQRFLDASSASNVRSASATRTASRARTPCWRFRVAPDTVVAFDDVFAGRFEQDVSRTLGDFPLARDEFGAGYTFACTVDDLLMGVTEVVRGDDLLAATPAQILLARTLWTSPQFRTLAISHSRNPIFPYSHISFLHVPLVVGRDGRRLAKRHGDTRIASYREAGKSPEEIVGFLAASCGWAKPGERVSLADLVPRFDLTTIPHAPFMV